MTFPIFYSFKTYLDKNYLYLNKCGGTYLVFFLNKNIPLFRYLFDFKPFLIGTHSILAILHLKFKLYLCLTLINICIYC